MTLLGAEVNIFTVRYKADQKFARRISFFVVIFKTIRKNVPSIFSVSPVV